MGLQVVPTVKILYDNGAFCQTYGGVSRYYAEMMRHLPADCQPVLTMSSTYNRYLQALPYSLPRMRQSVHDFVRDYCGGRYWPGVSHLYRVLATIFPWRFPSGERENDRLLDAAITILAQGHLGPWQICDAVAIVLSLPVAAGLWMLDYGIASIGWAYVFSEVLQSLIRIYFARRLEVR